MERWIRRVALVTGASSGIGAAVCKALVKQGMIVIGCARNVENIQKLSETEEVSKSATGQLYPMKCDVSKENEILDMFTKIRSNFQSLDVCVNSAGFANPSSLMSGKTEDWRSMLEVNVLGTCICTREAIQLMKEKRVKDGHIIQMGSIVGHSIPKIPRGAPIPSFGLYNGTKFMIRGLAESLRQEVQSEESSIHVATISPGPVETELMTRALSPEDAATFYRSTKLIQPEDVANAVLYVLQSPARVSVEDVVVQSMEYRL